MVPLKSIRARQMAPRIVERVRATRWLSGCESPTPSSLVLAGLAGIVLFSWVALVRRSFWLDETATDYFVALGWSDLWSRAAAHPQMPLGYYVAVKALGRLGLPEELGLRWPSLVAMATSCLLLHRLGSRLFGGGAALHATLIFASLPGIEWLGSNARPYALGILCVLAAALLLLRWLDEGRTSDGLGFALASAASVWMHFTMGIVLLAYGWYAIRRYRSGAVGRGALLAVVGVVALLTAPLAAPISRSWHSAPSLSFTNTPTVGALAGVIALPLFVSASLYVIPRSNGPRASPRSPRSPLSLLLAWALLPPLLTFAIAALTPAKIFVERYYISMYPALALLLGLLLQGFGTMWQRLLVLTVIVLGSVIVSQSTPLEDWRGVAHEVRALQLGPGVPILLSAGYVEARDPDFLLNPEHGGYVASPLFSYPIEGRVIPLPDVVGEGNEATVDRLVEPILEYAPRVLVLSRSSHPIVAWVRARAADRGFAWHELGDFSGMTAVLAERSGR